MNNMDNYDGDQNPRQFQAPRVGQGPRIPRVRQPLSDFRSAQQGLLQPQQPINNPPNMAPAFKPMPNQTAMPAVSAQTAQNAVNTQQDAFNQQRPLPAPMPQIQAAQTNFNNMQTQYGGARAAGGPVSKGKAYLVGEKGPEMVVPKQDGNVVPADKTAGLLSAGQPGGASQDGKTTAAAVDLASKIVYGPESSKAIAKMLQQKPAIQAVCDTVVMVVDAVAKKMGDQFTDELALGLALKVAEMLIDMGMELKFFPKDENFVKAVVMTLTKMKLKGSPHQQSAGMPPSGATGSSAPAPGAPPPSVPPAQAAPGNGLLSAPGSPQ